MGPQPLGTITPVDGNYSTRSAFESILAQNPNIDFGGLTADDVTRDFLGNIYGDINPGNEGDERLGSMGTLSDLGGLGTFGSLGGMAAQMMGIPPDTPTFTPSSSLTRQSDLEGNRGGSNQQGIQSLISPQQTGAPQTGASENVEEILTPSTASQTSTDSIYAPSYSSGENPVLSGLANLPDRSNYMDYLPYAFKTVDTANPFSGAPSGITGRNPLFRNNPVYAAGGGLIPTPIRDNNSYGHGGMTGFVGEPINIMYSGGMNNDVVDSEISGILKKYKQIRSKL